VKQKSEASSVKQVEQGNLQICTRYI